VVTGAVTLLPDGTFHFAPAAEDMVFHIHVMQFAPVQDVDGFEHSVVQHK
jgi:hypothetical protein